MSQRERPVRNPFRLLLHIPVPWVFVLAYLVGVCLELPFRPNGGGHSSAIGKVGAGAFTVGAVIAGWSLVIFYKARTTTVPGRHSSELVERGPYRLTRNPMYVGLALAYLGEAGLLQQLWPVILLPLVLAYLNWIVVPVEEAKLRDDFGGRYESYRAKVRRWL